MYTPTEHVTHPHVTTSHDPGTHLYVLPMQPCHWYISHHKYVTHHLVVLNVRAILSSPHLCQTHRHAIISHTRIIMSSTNFKITPHNIPGAPLSSNPLSTTCTYSHGQKCHDHMSYLQSALQERTWLHYSPYVPPSLLSCPHPMCPTSHTYHQRTLSQWM